MPIDKVITVQSSEVRPAKTSGKTYLEVVDQDGDKYSCWDESLWNNLGEKSTVLIGFEKKGIFRNIISAEPTKEIAKKIPPEPEREITGQERGMWAKELGNRIGDRSIDALLGKENAIEAVKWYRGQMLSILKIPYNGSKLPQWKPKE